MMLNVQNETTVDPRGGRWFWPAWGAAFLGFPIGGAAATALVGPIETVGAAAVAGAVAGGVIGAAQWSVLRRRLPLSPLWAPATAGAMAVGMALAHALLGDDTSPLPLLVRGLVSGRPSERRRPSCCGGSSPRRRSGRRS